MADAQKTLVRGLKGGFSIKLCPPNETCDHHKVYFFDNETGMPLVGLHEAELWFVGTKLIQAWAEIFYPDAN